jgi:hypothetical protein
MKTLRAAVLFAAISILMLPLSSASATTQPHRSSAKVAVAAASPGCKGYVLSFTKPGSYVQLRAMVSCNRVVDQIRVQAFLDRGVGARYSDVVNCKNRSSCSATVTHTDKSGTQKYWGGVVAGDVPVTAVWDNGSSWSCYVGITCTFDTAYY